jgi:hypothetical protein
MFDIQTQMVGNLPFGNTEKVLPRQNCIAAFSPVQLPREKAFTPFF